MFRKICIHDNWVCDNRAEFYSEFTNANRLRPSFKVNIKPDWNSADNDHTKIILVPIESPESQLSIGIKIVSVSKLSTSIEPIYFFALTEDAFKVR